MKPSSAKDEPTTYEIRVKGILDETWSDWLGGLVIVPQAGDETLLRGPVRDPAALHGPMVKIQDMGSPCYRSTLEIDSLREEESVGKQTRFAR